jgi:hypothetical protein
MDKEERIRNLVTCNAYMTDKELGEAGGPLVVIVAIVILGAIVWWLI